MCERQETQNWLACADEVYSRLIKSLQKRCAAARTFKSEPDLPFWCDCLKEALLLRSTELARAAIDLYRRNSLVSAAIITRSLLETTALFNRLYESCAKVVNKHEKGKCYDEIIEELLQSVSRISIGSTAQRDDATRPNIEPFKVPSLINSLDTRKLNGKAMDTYEDLCQMVHPNFDGCLDAFTAWDKKKRYMEFIQDYRHRQKDDVRYRIFLVLILNIVEELEKEMAGLLPKFGEACEGYLERQRCQDNEKDVS
jgi:hypothetical protein